MSVMCSVCFHLAAGGLRETSPRHTLSQLSKWSSSPRAQGCWRWKTRSLAGYGSFSRFRALCSPSFPLSLSLIHYLSLPLPFFLSSSPYLSFAPCDSLLLVRSTLSSFKLPAMGPFHSVTWRKPNLSKFFLAHFKKYQQCAGVPLFFT